MTGFAGWFFSSLKWPIQALGVCTVVYMCVVQGESCQKMCHDMPGIVGNYRFYPFTQGYIYKKICVGIVLDKKCF